MLKGMMNSLHPSPACARLMGQVDAANRSYFGTAIRGGLSPFPGVPVPLGERWRMT